MNGQIDNGRRAEAVFGTWSGTAGVTARGEAMLAAIRADPRALRQVSEGTLDGVRVRILAQAKSDRVTGMIVLTLEAADESPGVLGGGN